MFRRRGDTRRTTWGVSTQVVSRNGTNTPLSSGRTHVATGESGRRPGWPPPGTQASRHDMNSGWTCCAEAFGPGSRRAPLRSTPPSRLSAHTRLTRAVGWPLPQPAATPGLRGHWVLASQRPHQSAFSVGEPHSPVGYTKGLARHRGMMVDMPRPPGVCDTGSCSIDRTGGGQALPKFRVMPQHDPDHLPRKNSPQRLVIPKAAGYSKATYLKRSPATPAMTAQHAFLTPKTKQKLPPCFVPHS